MTDHTCTKEGAIGELTAMMRFFQDAERRRELREERMALAMEKVAAQGEIIGAHAETLQRHERAHSEAFARLRELEIRKNEPASSAGPVKLFADEPPVKRGLTIRLAESKTATLLVCLLALVFAIGMAADKQTVISILGLFK